MIFVVLGTHELPFDRLLKEIEQQIINGNITEEVLVQAGHTKFRSEYIKFIDFTTYEEMERNYHIASFIITHGGTGSITMGVKMGKKVIAVPRLVKYDEHNDDHQLEIVKQFYESGHILYWNEPDSLGEVLGRLDSFEPVPYSSGKSEILTIIKEFIEREVR
ncbi:PssE/Cps14G family polysaccharide biosynthesis glycosyltransferase [Bacillus infantis]|uniref:PssE/Cps14G family polysaccharide biosynthesis glycosyltransferase n=1 Tax=Bacillus infantis TaxID=324767 RepID=UPI003CE68E79